MEKITTVSKSSQTLPPEKSSEKTVEIPRILSGNLSGYSSADLESLQKIIQVDGLVGLLGEKQASLVSSLEEVLFKSFQKKQKMLSHQPFTLGDPLKYVTKCQQVIIRDDFTDCFRSNIVPKWNMNVVYFIMWLIGVVFRYCILMPLRLALLIVLSLLTFLLLFSFKFLKVRWTLQKKVIQMYCGMWLLCLGAVFVVHGSPPKRKKNQVYCCNHTSVLDIAFLNRIRIYSCIGQTGGGLINFFQTYILFPMKNMWFQRFEKNDRSIVRMRISEHIADLKKPPLLVFPEGVCVNNRYTVMFHKGIFEVEGVEICPITMKFNLNWSDPFFRNTEGFFGHVIRLMSSWCTYCDISFLKPTKRREGENAIEFSTRVKEKISKKAGLKSVFWDGYLKYFTASERWRKKEQVAFSEKLIKRLEIYESQQPKKSAENGNIVTDKKE